MGDRTGERIGPYRLAECCGTGAYGSVYLATQEPIGQQVALKFLHGATDVGPWKRELTGLRAVCNLSHPHIVTVLHIAEADGEFYYTMERADNLATAPDYRPATLENILLERGRFEPEEVIRLGLALCDALAFLAERRLVHRDIKPSNLLRVHGEFKLSDVGLVTEVEQSMTLTGTLGFLPPEVCGGAPYDPSAADRYAVAKVLYCALTGYSAQRFPELPNHLPFERCRELIRVINRGCARRPEKRFQSLEDFRRALTAAAHHGYRDYCAGKLQGWWRHSQTLRRWLTIGLLGGLLLGTGGTVGAMAYWHHCRQVETHRQEEYKRMDDGRELLAVYQRVYWPGLEAELAGWEAELERFRSVADPAALHSARERLREMAEREWLEFQAQTAIPEPGAPEWNAEELNRRLDRWHPYFETLLFATLEDGRQQAGRERVRQLQELWKTRGIGVMAGSEFSYARVRGARFVYVASGGYFQGPGRTAFQRIDHPIWVQESAVTNLFFQSYMGTLPSYNPEGGGNPVESVCWNDMLAYCRLQTLELYDKGFLDRRYIVRPLYAGEWEYAMRGGWKSSIPDAALADEYSWHPGNSGGVTHPVMTKKPNHLGLYDCYGNVSNVTMPDAVYSRVYQNCLLTFGGSYQYCAFPTGPEGSWLANHTWIHWTGFRVCIAEDTMDFFERKWFDGEPQATRCGEDYVEMFGGNASAFTQADAEEFCRVLGGKPAMFRDVTELREVLTALPLTEQFPVMLGVRPGADGVEWSDGRPAAEYDEQARAALDANPDAANVIYDTCKFRIQGEKTKWSLFLCRWTPEEYALRRQVARTVDSPLKLKQFSIGERHFILFKMFALPYVARRWCELMGGRLAIVNSPELRAQVAEELAEWSPMRILTGGYYQYDRWRFDDGSTETIKLPKYPGTTSVNNNFMLLYDHKWWDGSNAQGFLCEWPDESEAMTQ